MKLIKIIIGLTEQRSFCEEARVFPEHIEMLYGIDASKQVYDANYALYKRYKNIRLFNLSISTDSSVGKSLFDFVNENSIERIDSICINTDGFELDILSSLGNKIALVKEGLITCQSRSPAYVDQPTYEQCDSFLQANGFYIHSLNTITEGEWCLSFSRKGNEET